MLTPETIYSTIVTILSAVITGGFVLVFIEVGNRKNRENDRYRLIMEPFMRKLCAYFRYVDWVEKRIVYPKQLNENEQEFKFLMDTMAHYGSELIIGGGDYALSHFTAKELHFIGYGINNIWYYYDRMRPSNLQWDEDFSINRKLIDKELIKLDRSYLNEPLGLHQLSTISGEFFTDVYQPIEYEPENHELLSKLYFGQSMFVGSSLFLVLITLCLMISVSLSVCFIKTMTIFIVCLFGVCLLFLFVEERNQLQWSYNVAQWSRKMLGKRKRA
jgi:hypothetical protein